MFPVVGLLLTRGAVGLIYSSLSFAEMSRLVVCCPCGRSLLIVRLVAKCTSEAPAPCGFPEWSLIWADRVGEPCGGRSPQASGLKGAVAGDLKLPAPSVIPVACFLYSNKVQFDRVFVSYFKGHWGLCRALAQGQVGMRERVS